MGKKKDDRPKDQTEEKDELRPAASITPEFLRAYSDLPKTAQARTRELIVEFMTNPKSPGINFEALNDSLDDRVRSLRVDGVYRAIIVTPKKGNVYLFVHVDREDDAYRWAMKRKFSVDANSEEIIITCPLEEESQGRSESATQTTEAPLAHCSDEDLKSVGVPPLLLPSVRAIGHDSGYDLLSAYLPPGSVMSLRFLANKTPIQDVREFYLEYGERKETSGLSPVQASATLHLIDKLREDRKAGRPVNERVIEAIYKAREDHSDAEFMEKVVRNYPE